MKETLAIVASILAIIGNVPYLLDVVKKRIEPHAYTWFVWSIVSLVIFFGQLTKGAGIGALPTGVSEAFTLMIFIVSLKEGFKHVTKVDTFFLIVALLGLIPWALTDDATISVITVVCIDLIAFIPTLRKTWKYPRTENHILYTMNASRHFVALFALEAYNIATMLHSLTMFVVNGFMAIIIKFKKA